MSSERRHRAPVAIEAAVAEIGPVVATSSAKHFFMNSDHDRTLKMLIQALHDWWVSMGALAWVVLGVLLVVGIAMMLMLLRWIWSGGLSRGSSLGYCQRRRAVDESLLRDLRDENDVA